MIALPASPMTFCQALGQLTAITWAELGVGIETWQRLAEESVTDFNLMRLAASVPAIIIEKHTKVREAKTGADWELWVGRPGAYVGFRIQAKIMTPETASYEALYRSKGNAHKQADDLINSALSGQWPTYPLYSFYSHRLPTGTGPSNSPCAMMGTDAAAHGWVVASAFGVARILATSPTKAANAFESIAYPIPCLFCCPPNCALATSPGTLLAYAVAGRVARLWQLEQADRLPRLVHEIAPVYVERMFKGERPETGWEDVGIPAPRTRYLPEDLSRVVLIRDVGSASTVQGPEEVPKTSA